VIDYVSSDSNDQTSGTAWSNITDGHLNFTTSATGCVMITFEGAAFATPSSSNVYEVLYVRTLLDGNNLCAPALMADVFSDAEYPDPEIATSITRVCKNVAAGAHTIQVQFRGSSASGNDHINGHVLTVTHN
jgi:hypothetical protein